MSSSLTSENRAKAQDLLSLTRRAEELLQAAQKQLGSAKSWGIFDMLGGGLLSTLMKHNKIDGAMNYIHQAEPLMKTLGHELKQAAIALPSMHLSSFGHFADFFLDNVFADLYVQDRIAELQADLQRAQRSLDTVSKALEQMLA